MAEETSVNQEVESSLASPTTSFSEVDINPNQRLSSVLLNEFNYLPWSRAVTLALGGRAKLGYINGVIQAPEITSATYEAWLCKDQLVMSWLLNSMERKIAEIFSYSNSSQHLWKQVEEMYGNQNNAARIFQLKRDVASLQQEAKSFVQHLGDLTTMWNELDIYRPHTTDAVVLVKRAEEDKIFQLLASLSPAYEDLRSHILMNPELPSFSSVCATIQREEVRRRVMNLDTKASMQESRAFASSHRSIETKSYKGKRPDLKCEHCITIGLVGIGHTKDRCWVLHPELKPKFNKDNKGFFKASQSAPYRANHAANAASISTNNVLDFTSNPTTLLNEFAAYLSRKKENGENEEASRGGTEKHTALLGKFAGFLAEAESVPHEAAPGIFHAFSTALNNSCVHDCWIIDSGATDHMTNQRTNLHDFQNVSSQVSIANGKGVSVMGRGKIRLISNHVESTALYVPAFPFQLLSIGKITKTLNCLAIFSQKKVIFQDLVTGKTIGEGFFLNGLYYLPRNGSLSTSLQVSAASSSKQLQDPHLWHQRLAHPSTPILSKLFPTMCQTLIKCDTCNFSKFARLPFNSSLSRASKPFEIVHSDIWGPINESFDGYKYFVTFVDDFTRITWIYLLKFKSEVFTMFKDFHNLVTTHFESNLQTLRSDNGTEYMSNNMTQYLSMHGIFHQTSCVGTPQQNGVAERKNRDLLEKTRSLMLHMNIPKKFWSQGVLTATYLINRLPSRILGFKSPYEVLKNRPIDLSHLKVFGCTCFVHVQASHRDKLDPRSIKCVFLGYSSTQKGYKCFNPVTNKIVVSRDVKFEESIPFFHKGTTDSSKGETWEDLIPLPNPIGDIDLDHLQVDVTHAPASDASHPPDSSSHQEVDQVDASYAPVSDTSPSHQEVDPFPVRRYPPRARQPPPKLRDYVTYAARHPITLAYHRYSPSHAAFLSAISNHHEPSTFQEANLHPKWRQAMDEELQALNDNHTWSLVQLPCGKKAVGSRWVYKLKFHSDGSIERYKARLVARGFTQTYGVDYKETFAPVAKMNTVRVLLSVAVNQGWFLFQMDVKNAFLHGELEEEVYMQLPPGHSQASQNGLVCKLHKAIYGLKQSPRAWYAKLSSVLEEVGFSRSNADSSLFVRIGSMGKLVVLIYVDDLIITGDNMDEIVSLKQSLHQKFAIKDLGKLNYFLGIEMATSHKGLFLNQRKYVLDLLREVDMLDCKPVTTPLDCKLKLDTAGELLTHVSYYQRLVGKLIYLTITRPDITYAVSLVSQFMHAPTVTHLHVVKRILRYLKGSIGRGILMRNNGSTQIQGYTDADWAGNALDRKSTTGYCTFVGGNLVTWKSKKQNVIARSSAEAEYRAMASTACELIWLKSLLFDLGFPSNAPMSLMCDNQAAMHIASNPVFHERTKHIEVDCHYVRAQVQSKVIQTLFTRSHDQLADLFTKALPATHFQHLLGKLGSINLMDPA